MGVASQDRVPGTCHECGLNESRKMKIKVALELDAARETTLRAGDVAIQNGTRYAWRNRSGRCACWFACQGLGAVQTEPAGSPARARRKWKGDTAQAVSLLNLVGDTWIEHVTPAV